jgi:sugar lactone lactonase YvrE
VHLVDVPTQRVVATTALGGPRLGNESGWVQAAGPIPGTAAIAVLLDDGRLLRVDPLGRTATPLISLGPGNEQVVNGAAFSTAGRAVVALAANGRDRGSGQGSSLVVVDLVAGTVLNRFSQPVVGEGIAMTPDGTRAFLRPTLDGDVVSVDLATGQTRPVRKMHGRPVMRQA